MRTFNDILESVQFLEVSDMLKERISQLVDEAYATGLEDAQ